MKKSDEDIINQISTMEMQDIRNLLKLTNEYIKKFVDCVDPRRYQEKKEFFVNTALSGPSMIASVIIDKISGTMDLDREEILKKFIERLNVALKLIDYKKTN